MDHVRPQHALKHVLRHLHPAQRGPGHAPLGRLEISYVRVSVATWGEEALLKGYECERVKKVQEARLNRKYERRQTGCRAR